MRPGRRGIGVNRLKRIADGLGAALVGDCRTLVVVGALVVAVGLAGCGAPEPGLVGQQPKEDRAASPRSLPAVSDLPSVYRPVGEFAGRGEFYAAGGQLSNRLDDGNHYHGYDGPLVWATDGKSSRRQGVLYGVEDGAIVSAGYLIRQADLVSGKSFHGMSLRELDLPAARSMTVDLIPGEASDGGQYLWLWHFRAPPDAAEPMLPAGTLPAATTLPSGYTVFACDHIPETRFCPGMGRHFTDLSRTEYRTGVQSAADHVGG